MPDGNVGRAEPLIKSEIGPRVLDGQNFEPLRASIEFTGGFNGIKTKGRRNTIFEEIRNGLELLSPIRDCFLDGPFQSTLSIGCILERNLGDGFGNKCIDGTVILQNTFQVVSRKLDLDRFDGLYFLNGL